MAEQDNEILEVLRRRGGQMWLTDLMEVCDVSFAAMRRLQDQGHIIASPGLSAFHAHVRLNTHNAHSQITAISVKASKPDQ